MYRWHSDNSWQLTYYNNPSGFVTKMAESFTADIGGEHGDGVVFSGPGHEGHCTNATPCSAAFGSFMTYLRTSFGDTFAMTVGGGYMSNRSRYLILTPTGNARPLPQPESTQGIAYVPPSNAFDTNFGTDIRMWDHEAGFQYMPVDQFTFDSRSTSR
jgi:hypothetical protein